MREAGLKPACQVNPPIRVFLSYDREHDEDLHDLLAAQAERSLSGFVIAARSQARGHEDFDDEILRRQIQDVDQLVVICGEYTGESGRVGAELRVAQEENLPYLLLWGRREPMCTKPATARPADVMYSWTPAILKDQLQIAQRLSVANARD